MLDIPNRYNFEIFVVCYSAAARMIEYEDNVFLM